MIPFTFSTWLFAQHADSANMYQPGLKKKKKSNVPGIEIYLAEHVGLALCSQCQETDFYGTPPPASRKYLEIHRKHLLIPGLPAVSSSQGPLCT